MSSRLKAFLRSDHTPGLLAATVAFAAYFVTLSPSIGFIDAGELAAAAHTLGVAHPTGYPLFTMLASLFAKLPLGGTVIWRLNLFAAFLCAAAVWAFHSLFLSWLHPTKQDPERPPASSPWVNRTAAATGALSLAFARTFWAQATGVEVYSLHLLLVALILLAFHRKRWFLFAFALGLGFSNHMTTVLLVPALAFGYFASRGFGRAAWKDAGLAAPFFFLGLTPYLYLPIRAAAHPVMNWGAIVDWESFRWHVTGKQYAGWMFSSWETAVRQTGVFFETWPSETGYLPLALAALGLAALFRASRRLFACSLLLFAGCLAYAVNYDITDVANYFLLAYVVTALWAAFGARALLAAARGRTPRAAIPLVCAACAACVASPLVLNAREANERGNHAVEDYARNLLDPLPRDAVIFSSQWDHFVAGAWYLQFVEGVRPDVAVTDYELLRRSWYLRHLRQRYPEWTADSRAEIDAFLSAVHPFEHGKAYVPAHVQAAFEAMVNRLMASASATRPVYVTRELAGEAFGGGWGRRPEGAAFLLYRGNPPPVVFHDLSFRPFPQKNLYFSQLRRHYAYAFLNQGIHLGLKGNLDACERFFVKARDLAPESPEVAEWWGRLQAWKASR